MLITIKLVRFLFLLTFCTEKTKKKFRDREGKDDSWKRVRPRCDKVRFFWQVGLRVGLTLIVVLNHLRPRPNWINLVVRSIPTPTTLICVLSLYWKYCKGMFGGLIDWLIQFKLLIKEFMGIWLHRISSINHFVFCFNCLYAPVWLLVREGISWVLVFRF